MNEPIVTTDSILKWLKDAVEHKVVVDSHTWIDAAQKLTALLGGEHDNLFFLEQQTARARISYIEQGFTVAKAKAYVESSDVYKEMRLQKAKIGRIEEMVRIAKIQSRLKDNEFGAQV